MSPLTCSFHGTTGITCALCRAETIASDAESLRLGDSVVGVFEYRSDGNYPFEDAVRVFKRRGDAERRVEKMNADSARASVNGYVARLVRVPRPRPC